MCVCMRVCVRACVRACMRVRLHDCVLHVHEYVCVLCACVWGEWGCERMNVYEHSDATAWFHQPA